MQLIIQRPERVTPEGAKAFLDGAQLKLSVFFDEKNNIVLDFNPRHRFTVLRFIDWLIVQ